jgi:hypothetical protein
MILLIFFQKLNVKLNSRTWMTLKFSVSDFSGLRISAASMTSTASIISVASITSTVSFNQEFTHFDSWIIPSTQKTNTSPILLSGSSKIQFVADIWYHFCRSLLRPAYGTFLKTGRWNSNFQTSQTCYAPKFNRIIHGLRTPREEKAFTARPKIQSQSQIFRYGRSIFCLPHRPIFSDIFDLCLHWVSVVRGIINCSTLRADLLCSLQYETPCIFIFQLL